MIPGAREIRPCFWFSNLALCQKDDFSWWDPNFSGYGIEKASKRIKVRIEVWIQNIPSFGGLRLLR